MLMAPVGNRVDRLDRALLPQAHDRALAELLLDLADGQFDRLHAFLVLAIVAVVLVATGGMLLLIIWRPPDGTPSGPALPDGWLLELETSHCRSDAWLSCDPSPHEQAPLTKRSHSRVVPSESQAKFCEL